MRSPSWTHSRSQPRTRGSPLASESIEARGRSTTPEAERSATPAVQMIQAARRRVGDAGAVVGAGILGELLELITVLLHPGGIGPLARRPVRVERMDVAVRSIVAVMPPDQRLPLAVAVLLFGLAFDLPELVHRVDDHFVVLAVARGEALERLLGVHPLHLRDPGRRVAAVPRPAGRGAQLRRHDDVDEQLPADAAEVIVSRHYFLHSTAIASRMPSHRTASTTNHSPETI